MAKLFIPLIKRSVSPQFYAIFGKLNFWRNIDRHGPYKNGENLNYLKLCKELFFVKIICSTHQRKSFSTILGNFWKIEFLKEYRQARTLKMVIVWTISICAKKIFFGKIICSTHQRKDFSTILRNFWKIEFLKEYRQARSLTKMLNIWTILNCAKKIFFCQNYLFHSSKEVFLNNFREFWENWIFEGISTGADLKKWW